MERSEYLLLADSCIDKVADWLEAFDPDEVDFSSADGVLKIEFADGKVYVLNRQTAVDQMWFAAGASAWHYDWNGTAWLSDKDGHELAGRIHQEVESKLGRSIEALKF